jgi:serine/threonine protein kinase
MQTRRVLNGRYQLIRQIGEGGFSRAYLAEDTLLGRRVVAKIMRFELRDDPASHQRFEREARIAASVSGPNIVAVYDYGTDEGQPVIISQWIDGVDLSKVVRPHIGLRPDDSISIMLDILGGLETLHESGVQHRDIKPQNVLIPKWDAPAKLTDFGISRGVDDPRITLTGQVLGSPSYMSPEQVEGMHLDHATDIYSASVVLFELITGELPFKGDSASQIMLQHLASAPPPPRLFKPEIDPELERLILKGLSKPPHERFDSARIMAQELTSVLKRTSDEHNLDRSAYRTRIMSAEPAFVASNLGPESDPLNVEDARNDVLPTPGTPGRKRGFERPRKRIPFRNLEPDPVLASKKKKRSWFRIRRKRIPRYPFVLAILLFATIMLLAIIQSVSASIQSGNWSIP